ncbi:type II secretion system protein [uncultured Ilyobacter sp.]|uniref:type IV pilus modification PilV family protein n=1 Tax=uncultured Ilyobacter sp. TaxID=544433 RepID=UPI0029C08F32|nr:type II secretion system protein [uncultured Ilyobacter sp.]
MSKKKGTILLEVVIAIVIFLIGILPIIGFTVKALGQNKRTTELEEDARVVTSVIDYIKSMGYVYVSDYVLSGVSTFDKEYILEYEEAEDSYVVDTVESTSDFETDFWGEIYNEKSDEADALFLLESRGLALDGAKLSIVITKTDLTMDESNYVNPVSNESTSNIIGDKGVIADEILYGRVVLEYTSTKDNSGDTKEYGQNFVLTPVENWGHLYE